MADLSPRYLNQIKAKYPEIGACLEDVVKSHNYSNQQTNASAVGVTPPPTSHAALTVTGGAGFFAAQITDNAPSFRGKENFLEVSEDRNFTAGNVHTVHLGASTSHYHYYGGKVLHFRSYPALPTSGPAAPIYAYDVSGLGETAPAIAGNGTAAGWGTQPYTTDTVPIR